MDAEFKKLTQELNEALQAQKASPGLEKGVEVALRVLRILGLQAVPKVSEVIDEKLVKLPNAERQDPWFNQHPWMRGERAAFELVDADEMPLQAKLYWIKKKSRSSIAGAVHFTKNWEDHDFTRNENFKIGIDFFIPPTAGSVLVILSNRGKLRVLELEKKLSNTQIEIFSDWYMSKGEASQEKLHALLWDSFRLQSVNLLFYKGVSDSFNELVNELVASGREPEAAKLFTSRLIGRLIFIWFLRKMRLISEQHGYFEPELLRAGDFYHQKLEPLFFATLNTPVDERSGVYGTHDFESPYLNGGLFAPQVDDWVGDETLAFPDKFFTLLFAHFSRFNFTTDESTPEFEQIAIDPEMLGKVFESLLASQVSSTGEQGRKAKGAYYTPRIVVSFMVKESVRNYLLNKMGRNTRNEQVIGKLFDTSDQDWAIAGTNSLRDIPLELRDEIARLLDQMKTIDPACGSGAFPLGMLHFLAKLHMRLDPRLDPYKLKLSILQNNIFGVDIEPMAVEISRLRSWLSLVVEEGGSKAIQPLPNLEFNFVASNSLVPLLGEGLHTDTKLSEKLSQIRQDYFSTSSPDKKKAMQDEYSELISPSLSDDFDDVGNQLKTFNPFSPNNVAEFFNPGQMFGIQDGFDIVIGNPPYLGEKGHGDTFAPVRASQLGQRFYVGKMDYFYFFFHLGLDLLDSSGVLCFITTNYFLTAKYASNLRADIEERARPILLINFAELKVFESAQGQHNLITLLTKSKEVELTKTVVFTGQSSPQSSEEALESIFGETSELVDTQKLEPVEVFSGNQIRLTGSSSHEIEEVLDQMAAQAHRLSIHFNALTGAQTQADKVSKAHAAKFGLPESQIGNGIFVLKNDELEELDLDEHESEIVKPWFKNSDIRRYKASEDSDEVVIFADKRTASLDSRPKLLSHLNKYREIIDAASSNSPYMHRPRSIDFDGPKIVTPYKTPSVRFAMSTGPWYASGDVYFITQKTNAISLWTLLGILNSDLLNTWFWYRGKRKGNLIEMYEEPLSAIPLPAPTARNASIFERIGSLALRVTDGYRRSSQSSEVEALEMEIDQAVFELYGLDARQVEIAKAAAAKLKDN